MLWPKISRGHVTLKRLRHSSFSQKYFELNKTIKPLHENIRISRIKMMTAFKFQNNHFFLCKFWDQT